MKPRITRITLITLIKNYTIGICRAIIEPKRKLSLIGQLVLEDTDLWIDSKNGRLVLNPESPDEPLMQIGFSLN